MQLLDAAPAALGFRHPAEWEPQAATWLAFPHNRTDYPGKLRPVQWAYGEIIRKLADRQPVHVVVQDTTLQAQAQGMLRRVGANLTQVRFFRVPTNRGWLRDAGPIFVVRDQEGAREAAICKFRFNAWAKYPDFRLDDELALRLAKQLGFPVFVPHAKGQPVVLEGGAVDVNGQGVVMTTEECLLDTVTQPRNPHLSRAEVEAVLRDTLGVSTVWWLGKGIAGDDTHGHVDDLARFVNPTTLVLCDETDAGDANYAALRENHERAQDFRLPDGSRPEVIRLPMPRPLIFAGQRLPASYANFYIANELVLVPTFNDPNDRVALGILGECFPNRTVCGIHAVDLVWGLGTLHCLTHEQPAGVPAAPEPAPTSPQGASLVKTD
ncbi:agmatine/peptidylarginine deiminase [Chloracidobacterium thermophilum]|uniref:agmatine deiminase family protein n=1 Tax=Chloracidobacterium thermophilum TaxID=458033 RepID=UPI000738CAB8|nr:agmatine deiminase family protein [Chloracidobacterium thermophilum]